MWVLAIEARVSPVSFFLPRSRLRAEGIESLTLTVLADNAAARALYESLGFTESGVEPRAVKRDGRYVDMVSYWISVTSHPPSPAP